MRSGPRLAPGRASRARTTTGHRSVSSIHAGWSARGRIPDMTDAQHLFLQKQLGLPATSPLRTVSRWRAAILGRATGR